MEIINTKKEVRKIFDADCPSHNHDGKNILPSLIILSKYTTSPISAAQEDYIFSMDVKEIIGNMTKSDAVLLAELGWFINWEYKCLSCWV